MSNVSLIDLLKDGNNEFSSEIKDERTTTKKLRKEVSVSCNQNILSSSTTLKTKPSILCSEPSVTKQHDIDINYAINLLKKEDQNMNVFRHLQGILDKILLERPTNPLDKFEQYSQMLKRMYVHEEANFERVFVDNINRKDCHMSLEIYKCALKKQMTKQKQYNDSNKSAEKWETSKIRKKTISNDNSNVVDVQVQNIWESNNMFNKAGCGLPLDEVASISLTLNGMAQLNKFKSVRFWGKIFGLKNVYFIIECEWTDAELNRKLSTVNHDPGLMTHIEANHTFGPYKRATKVLSDVPDLKSLTSAEKETELTETLELRPESDLNLAVFSEVTNGSIISNNRWTTSSNHNGSALWSEVSKLTAPETFGTGANRSVYFVTNDLNTKWIELESVQPHHINEARKIKRYFTGKLHDPINSYPKFKGLEIDYLRAQIARISLSTQIYPQGYYVVNRKEKTQNEISDTSSRISIDLTKTMKYEFIPNKDFKPIFNYNLINSSYWVHKYSQLDINGVTNESDLPTFPESKTTNNSSNDLDVNENEENYSYINKKASDFMEKSENIGNLRNDITVDGTPAWKGILCSPFDTRHSCIMMKSHIWPGACAVVCKSKMDFIYVGWALKQDYISYSSNLTNTLKTVNPTKEDLIEYQELTKDQVANFKQNSRNQNKQKMFSFNSREHKESEKIINNYKYE